MSFIWNSDSPSRSAEKRINRACTVALILSALYLAGHILAAWLRGSFEVTR
jgi:hypothetical protein